MMSALGVTVTMSQLDSVLRVLIAVTTLVYAVFKSMSAYREWRDKKHKCDEKSN